MGGGGGGRWGESMAWSGSRVGETGTGVGQCLGGRVEGVRRLVGIRGEDGEVVVGGGARPVTRRGCEGRPAVGA